MMNARMKGLRLSFSAGLFIFGLSLLLVPAAGCGICYAGESDDSFYYQWLILDEADLLTEAEESKLYDNYIDPLLDYCNVFFSTVTLSANIDYERYAENFYYDVFGNEPGIHFQIDMGNRKLTLCASTGMETLIGSERDSIVDNVYKMASAGNYYDCAAECLSEILTLLQGGEIAHTMKYIDNGILAIILALLLNFILAFIIGQKHVHDRDIVTDTMEAMIVSDVVIKEGHLSKIYDPQTSSDSDSGGSSDGGFSGGSSSHGF